MPINAGPEFFKVEKEYLAAQTPEDKIYWLEELIKSAPKHKSSENLLKELRTRLKKLRQKAEAGKKRGGGKKGIRKEGFQFVLVGKTNSGKSSLLKALTNATPKIAAHAFSTKVSEVGTFEFQGVRAQIVDMPSIESEYFDTSLVHTADCLILVIEKFDDLDEVSEAAKISHGKRLVVLNKSDIFNGNELRKLKDRMKSKRLNGEIVSAIFGTGVDLLKEKLFGEMDIVRVFTKEPGKPKTKEPIVLQPGSSVRDVAEKILKGFSLKIKETRLTGPSSKFSNQRVGLTHKVKDLDIVEFRT